MGALAGFIPASLFTRDFPPVVAGDVLPIRHRSLSDERPQAGARQRRVCDFDSAPDDAPMISLAAPPFGLFAGEDRVHQQWRGAKAACASRVAASLADALP